MHARARVPRRVGRILIGCSGWQYESWKGTFYPPDLPQSEWLSHYTRDFPTVEVNNTFYRLPERRTFAAWRAATPRGFVVAIKASRYLTHMTRLRAPDEPLSRLLSRIDALGPRLGPILFQLPSSFRYDAERLDGFLQALGRHRAPPRHTGTQAVNPRRRLRFVIEFRDPSWYQADVFRALSRARVAVCQHDMPGSALDSGHETPFVYRRFHGVQPKYGGSYESAHLRSCGERLRAAAARGHDVYAYFNNDAGGAAVANARTLMRCVAES